MYTLVESFVRTKREWQKASLANVKTNELLTGFEEAHITLKDGEDLVNWRPMLSVHRPTLRTTPFTLTEWIAHCNENNIRLDTTSTPFTFEKLKGISSHSAYDIGFSVDRSNFYINPNSDANKLGEDLRLTRPNTDYSKFVGNVLLAVNGRIHPTSSSDNGFYAKGGHKALRGGAVTDVNLINFQELGGFKVERLVTSKMYKQEGGSVKLYDNCCFNLGYKTTDKVFGIVIDGYLHLLDGVVQVIGKSSIRINWRMVPLLKRAIMDAGTTLSDSTVRNLERVSEADVRTNEWISDLISSPFTFLVTLKRSDITRSTNELISKGLAGIYEYPYAIDGMAMLDSGNTLSYKKFADRSSYAIAREGHTVYNLAVKPEYPSLFDTRLKGLTQYGTDSVQAGGVLKHPVVKMVQYHVLPENF